MTHTVITHQPELAAWFTDRDGVDLVGTPEEIYRGDREVRDLIGDGALVTDLMGSTFYAIWGDQAPTNDQFKAALYLGAGNVVQLPAGADWLAKNLLA